MLSILVAHSYFLRFDEKAAPGAKPYPPLATLQVAALLREAGAQGRAVRRDVGRGRRRLRGGNLAAERPQVVLFYEDNYNFLSKMCLGKMRAACCEMIASASAAGRA